MDNRPIGMFDSGVGGITVLKEVKNELPNEDIIYIGDTACFPYGSKSKETIIELTKINIEKLIQKNVKLVIIACGTATSQALQEVRPMFDIPIIGIIEPTVEYLKNSNKREIGVIATKGTIKSKGWENALKQEIESCNITNKACPMLAPMAEEGWTQNDIAKLAVREYLKDMKNIDLLILGCTHYPLFKGAIVEELGSGIEVINTGEMVANYVEQYLKDSNMLHEKNDEQKCKIYLTDLECNFINVANNLLGDSKIIENIEKLS